MVVEKLFKKKKRKRKEKIEKPEFHLKMFEHNTQQELYIHDIYIYTYMHIYITNSSLPNFQVSKEEEVAFFVEEKTSPLKQSSKKGFHHQFGSQYSTTAK